MMSVSEETLVCATSLQKLRISENVGEINVTSVLIFLRTSTIKARLQPKSYQLYLSLSLSYQVY